MQRAQQFTYAVAMAFILALWLAAPVGATCLPDPLRDAAYVEGRAPRCTEQRQGETTNTLPQPRVQFESETWTPSWDQVPSWLAWAEPLAPYVYVRGYNRPNLGPSPDERTTGLGGSGPRGEIGIVILRRSTP